MDMTPLTVAFMVISSSVLAYMYLRRRRKTMDRLGIRAVCISDTHGNHRKLSENLPSGDVLIHGGDFTRFGNINDVEDFNRWLSEMKIQNGYQYVIVVNGNHESNVGECFPNSTPAHYLILFLAFQAPWQSKIKELLNNAIVLKNEATCLSIRKQAVGAIQHQPPDSYGLKSDTVPPLSLSDTVLIRVFGTDFFWPTETNNPYYNLIPERVDIIVSHGPCKGMVDGGR
jgi:predicted phosphodiesterase